MKEQHGMRELYHILSVMASRLKCGDIPSTMYEMARPADEKVDESYAANSASMFVHLYKKNAPYIF